MKKILLQLSAFVLCLTLCVPSVFAAGQIENMIQVGLTYDIGQLAAANLENNTGYGAGYRFGYFDKDLDFVELGYTTRRETAITMLRTSEMYLNGSTYSTSKPSGSYQTIGCYHVVLGTYRSFEDAQDEADQYDNGFVAWINGEYQVREGAYTTLDQAREACGLLDGEDIKGTSSYAVNVVETGTTDILFQFDGGSSLALGVMPDVTGADEVRTWFKGYKYWGGFRYERIDGGSMTVVNIVDLETYVRGVIPYEMSNSWPLEALKAQAVCARSYAYNKYLQQGHRDGHYDICNTEHCQVYHGAGLDKSNYQANATTDRAVEETEGIYALYNRSPIEAYYASSHGGASERVDNVWSSSLSKYPYLCGVVDPYEEKVSSINSYSYWTKTVTAAELTQRLQARGIALGTTVSSLELTYSELGNVIQAKVYYTNGKSSTFTPKMNWGLYSLFGGLNSLHFTINGQAAASGSSSSQISDAGVAVNETGTLDSDGRLYVISGTGSTSRVDASGLYTISGTGTVSALDSVDTGDAGTGASTPAGTVVTITGSTYRLEGSGLGHQIGMSQYGAYAMANEGFTYDEIVEFYFPGVRVDFFS